jgi:hypothetical protein
MAAPGRQETGSQHGFHDRHDPAQPPSFGSRGGERGNNFPIDATGLGKF